MAKLGKSAVLENTRNRINELLFAESNTLAECEKNIKKYELIIEKEEKKKAEAYDQCDGDAYKKAEDAIENAKNCAAMYRKKLANQEGEAIISDEEYATLLATIIAELDKINAMAAKYVVKMCNEIASICDIVGEYIVEGNEMLQDLQHKVKKDEACLIVGNGQKVHSESLEQRYTKYDLLRFKEKIVGKNPEAVVGNMFLVIQEMANSVPDQDNDQ